jgi:hypothetical protein
MVNAPQARMCASSPVRSPTRATLAAVAQVSARGVVAHRSWPTLARRSAAHVGAGCTGLTPAAAIRAHVSAVSLWGVAQPRRSQ